jgi:anthranilate/para-aminobenzoate synthase component I
MKGTRPSGDAPEDLIDSKKDAAELHMIVDLMRNDLGRVCEFGSLQVTESRGIELHPTVWQSVGEVRGKLSQSNSIIDLLAATFPAGSITGAPKIRAMEIINELEESTRGAYCGAIGIIGGSMMLNVAIRIATFHGSGDTCHFSGRLHYGTGCGIVADSVPIEECAESHVKTDIIRSSPLFT